MKIKTQSGSVYFIDAANKVISGGKLTHPVKFRKASLLIGDKGRFILENGQTLITSVIVSY